jgi:hypothetical protein
MAAVSASMAVLAIPITVFLVLSGMGSRAQLPSTAKTSSDTSRPILPKDSIFSSPGKLINTLAPTPGHLDSTLQAKGKSLLEKLNPVNVLKADTGRFRKQSFTIPSAKLFGAPLIAFKGGYVNYGFDYRSNIDTPYAEKDITQHILTGGLNLSVAKNIPLKVNYWIRRSNSSLFRDITDVQVAFDPAGFRNNLVNQARQQWRSVAGSLNDSLLEKLYGLKGAELKEAANWLHNPFQAQKLREYRELIQIPSLSYNPNLPDSVNKRRGDSLQRVARLFIDTYSQTKGRYDQLQKQTDSLKEAVVKMHQRLQQYQQLLNGQVGDWASYDTWKNELGKYQSGQPTVPDKYKWLMGIRSFSAGRTPINYSELTAKNISLTGVNFEFNSWYYLAFTAGLVDYRFRDFVVNRFNTTPQYLTMLRLGIGRLEKNYLILSVFRGKKQLYTSSSTTTFPASITITGLSVQAKWQLHRTTSLVAEAAESLSPNYQSTPPATNGKFTLTDNTNKALSLQLRTYLPKTRSLVEGMYKYTGANYQSFSSFQTNAAAKSWYIKGEQSFFKQQLRLTAALRSNEFTNPYIIQDYKSNTVFKSINAVFRRRNWPVITIGFVPMSQLTVIDQQVVENRFQTFTASMNHFYRLGTQHASSTLVYNRFYNTSVDTGFIYFNSVNFFYAQNFLFRRFSAGLAASHSTSSQYELDVIDGNVHINLRKISVGGGIKINSLNRKDTKGGGYGNLNLPISRKDMIYLSYEQGYLPGTGKQLVRNDMGSIQYSRRF